MWSLVYNRHPTYHTMVIVHHFIIIVAGLVRLRIVSSVSSPLSQVVGAMRSSHQVFALHGVSFLVNCRFKKTGSIINANRT